MTQTNKEKIYDELVALSVALGSAQNPKRLEIYANVLGGHDLRAVIGALRGFYVSARVFPQLVDIIENLGQINTPTEDVANQIASDIISSISRFGFYNLEDAKKHLGNKFVVVERFGGWRALCELDNSSIQTARAQLRDLAKSLVNESKNTIRKDIANNRISLSEGSSDLKKLNFGGILDGNK